MSSERHLHPLVLSASSDYLGFRREQWASAIIEELKGKSEDEFCSSLETIDFFRDQETHRRCLVVLEVQVSGGVTPERRRPVSTALVGNFDFPKKPAVLENFGIFANPKELAYKGLIPKEGFRGHRGW